MALPQVTSGTQCAHLLNGLTGGKLLGTGPVHRAWPCGGQMQTLLESACRGVDGCADRSPCPLMLEF